MATTEEPPYLYLTTIGRRSRVPREIEIWFTRHDGRYYVISEHHKRARWVQNLLANQAARWRVADVTFTGRVRVIDAAAEPELTEAVQALSRQKYGWGDGLVVELTPAPAA